MPSASNQTDHQMHSSTSNEDQPGEERENAAPESGNQGWNINIEINSGMLNNPQNVNQEDVTAVFNSLRQLLRQVDLVYFVSFFCCNDVEFVF
jgi:hypothetical protein